MGLGRQEEGLCYASIHPIKCIVPFWTVYRPINLSLSQYFKDGCIDERYTGGHKDKQSSEIMTPKRLKGLNNNITQTKCYCKHCLRKCYLVCVILLFTLFKF